MRDKLANRTATWLESNMDDEIIEWLNDFKKTLYIKIKRPIKETTREGFRENFEYAFKALYGETFKLVLIFLIAYMLNVFTPMIAMTVVFCTIRLVAGGGHMDSFIKCFISTLLIFMIGIGVVLKLNTIVFSGLQLYSILIITYLISLSLSLKYAPRDNLNKTIENPIKIKSLKRLTIILITILTCIISIKYINDQLILLSCSMGMLLEMLTLTPFLVKLFSMFDYKKESGLE